MSGDTSRVKVSQEKAHRLRRRWRRQYKAAIGLAAAGVPMIVSAGEKDWNPAILSGSWANSANWLQNAVPVNGDDVFITNLPGDALNHTVTYDSSAGALDLNTLKVDNAGAGTNTL